MFYVSKTPSAFGERIGSCVALAILIAIWAVGYTIVCPPDQAPRHFAHEARR